MQYHGMGYAVSHNISIYIIEADKMSKTSCGYNLAATYPYDIMLSSCYLHAINFYHMKTVDKMKMKCNLVFITD